MKPEEVRERLGALGVVPVIAIDSVDAALPLADALIAGGLPCAEITFRSDAAADVIARLKKERPGLLLGAGTVLTPEQARKARDCGAEFAVSPGFNAAVVREAQRVGLVMAPGVMTPTDVEAALGCGISLLKFFPAEAAGGLKMLKSLAAPYRHLGVRFIPTGGVTAENAAAYLAEDAVLAVAGTWLAPKGLIASGSWDKIEENCRNIVGILKSPR